MIFRAVLVLALLAVASSDCTVGTFSGDQLSVSQSSTGTCAALSFDCSSNIVCSGGASAGQLASGNKLDLYFTTYNDHYVGKQSVTYGDNSISFDAPFTTVVSGLQGADGIINSPAVSDELLVGAQNADIIYRIKISTGVATPVNVPFTAYHLSPISATELLFASYVPSAVFACDVATDGSISGCRQLNGDRQLNSIIKTPSGYYFTSSANSGQQSAFGLINFDSVAHPTAFTTTVLQPNLVAHSGTWDPFSQKIVTYGYRTFTQLNVDGSIYSQLTLPGGINMDQGGLDGQGHAFIADNNGHLVYVAYRNVAGNKVENAFVATPFLANNLDDIAPLIGLGGTC